MTFMDYVINPVLMGGIITETDENKVKVNLHGRLGVITILREYVLSAEQVTNGMETEFYFSYLYVRTDPYDYDSYPFVKEHQFAPTLLGGVISEVNDTAIKCTVMDGIGTVAVPRRWVFTDVFLEKGQTVEFYFSPMRIKEGAL